MADAAQELALRRDERAAAGARAEALEAELQAAVTVPPNAPEDLYL